MLSNQKLMTVIPVAGCIWLMWATHQRPLTPWQILGAIIGLPALGLWVVARFQLGKSFAIKAEARQLVTTGLYSKIRNPIYVFGLLFITGIILYLERFWFLLLIPVLLVMQVWRARAEAAVLEVKFGDEYRQWRARTWF